MKSKGNHVGIFLLAGVMLLSLFSAAVAQADTEEYLNNPPGCEWGVLYSGHASAYSLDRSLGGYIVACTQWLEESGPPPWGTDIWASLLKLNLDGTVDYYMPVMDPAHPEHATAALGVEIVPSTTGIGDDGYVITGLKWQHHEGPGGHDFYQRDLWLMRATVDGHFDWDVTFGGLGDNFGNSIALDYDGITESYDYVIGGRQADVTGFYGGWLLRTDSVGTVELDRDLWDPDSGWLSHEVYSTKPTEDGGYINGTDYGMVKTDALGGSEWRVVEVGIEADRYHSVAQTSDGGYIGVGARDMYLLLTKVDAGGDVEWSRTFGNREVADSGRAVVEASGGGYALVGDTRSYFGHGHGGADVWLIKTDDGGEMEWDQVLGGSGTDRGYALVESTGVDPGYVVAGQAEFEGASRIWVFKSRSTHTPPIADFTYSPESPVFVSQTVLFDASASTDPDGSIEEYYWDFGDGETAERTDAGPVAHAYSSPGEYSITLKVTDDEESSDTTTRDITVEEMAVQWERTIGGTGSDIGFDIVEALDGGFVVTGYSSSSPSYAGSYDAWLFKADENGNLDWERRFADWSGDPALNEFGEAIAYSGDGGYILTGATGGGSTNTDLWLIKTDIAGVPAWTRKYGGDFFDEGYSVAPAHGEGYIVGGMTSAGGLDRDFWLIKTYADGSPDWEQIYDEPGPDYCHAVAATSDGGYIATGQYDMTGDGPLPLIKTDDTGVEVWSQEWTDPFPNDNFGHWVAETDDGGFVVAGGYEREVSLMKASAAGTKLWDQYYSGGGDDGRGYAAAETLDGGYIIAGSISPSPGDDDIYLVKTDAAGNLQWERTFGTDTTNETASGVIALDDGGYVILANQVPHLGTKHNVLLIKIGPYEPAPDFGLVAPGNGALLGTAPTFEWNPGDYDLFRLFAVFNYPGVGYHTVSFWLADSSFPMPGGWWDILSPGVSHFWTVLGFNSGTGAWELGDVWSFTKF